MEKRVLGIVLTILGILGLVMAAVSFVNGASGTHDIKAITVYAILGLLFFFAGIGIIRSTKDTLKNDERIS
jgi:uncharacterized membrane protein